MGVSFAKSIRFGAVRFNLSGSGIGVSVGVPGLRIGTGPRGAYISGGMGGFRYRKSLAGARRTPGKSAPGAMSGDAPSFDDLQAALEERPGQERFDTADVLTLDESDSEGLVQTLREQQARPSWWPLVAALSALLFVFLPSAFGDEGGMRLAVFVIGGLATWYTSWRDRVRRLTVVFYDLEAQAGSMFEALTSAARTAAGASSLTAVTSRVAFGDTKRNAGATHGLDMKPARVSFGHPPGLVANLPFPMLSSERTTVVFLPDQVLLLQGRSIGAVDYASLAVECHPSRFIESSSHAPRDATVVDHTWRYVNRDGGPDRRFNNNVQLPVCRYSALELTSAKGLNLRFMSSRDGGLQPLEDAIEAIKRPAAALAPAPTSQSNSPWVPASPHHSPQPPSLQPVAPRAGRTFAIAGGIATAVVALIFVATRSGPAETAATDARTPAVAPSALPSAPGISPSFDCSKAKATSDKLICASPVLAAKDAALAQHLIDLKQVAGDLRKALTADAVAAWKDRQLRCRTEACLAAWYDDREDALKAWEGRIAAHAASAAQQPITTENEPPPASAEATHGPVETSGASQPAQPAIYRQTFSFQCDQIRSEAQHLICSDVELGQRQMALQRMTDGIRMKVPVSKLDAFIAESAQALIDRDTCADRACVTAWFDRRARELNAWSDTRP